ncbi:MAG: nucleotidyl transferase AbiEii/AbiGii toxin family protein, partial [Proteobacteria bacterium]|nr:nucleotidyl transferase AbiEii/AbiGii toxin family protein [Pseudomonadota bacterium]
SSELLIEVNAFTSPEPFEKRELQALIAKMLVGQNRQDLIEEYNLQGFLINVLSVKRTLVEKILAMIKDSYDDDPIEKLSGQIRHLYDICMILKHDEYRDFITGSDFRRLCNACIADEKAGFFGYSECFEKPLKKAPLFSEFKNWSVSLGTTYTGVFSDLVYRDLPSMKEIEEAMLFIKRNL